MQFFKRAKNIDLSLMLVAVILANINPIFAKMIFQSGWSPAEMYFVTLIVIVVIMLLNQVINMEQGGKWGMTKDDIFGTLLATIFGGVLGPLLFFEGLTMVSASTSIILTSMLPLFVVLFAILLLKENFTMQTVLGGALLIGAMCLLLWNDIMSFQVSRGVPLIMGSSMLSALTIIVHKKYVKHRHIDAVILVRTSLSLVCVGMWILFTEGSGFEFLFEPQNIWPVLAMPICSFIIPYFLYFRALANLKASDAGVMEALGRIFGISAAAALLGESLGVQHLTSAVIATFGILIINVPLTKWKIAPSRLPGIGPMRR